MTLLSPANTSTPSTAPGVWAGSITRVDETGVWVTVPRLASGYVYGPIPGNGPAYVGGRVVVGFIEGRAMTPEILVPPPPKPVELTAGRLVVASDGWRTLVVDAAADALIDVSGTLPAVFRFTVARANVGVPKIVGATFIGDPFVRHAAVVERRNASTWVIGHLGRMDLEDRVSHLEAGGSEGYPSAGLYPGSSVYPGTGGS